MQQKIVLYSIPLLILIIKAIFTTDFSFHYSLMLTAQQHTCWTASARSRLTPAVWRANARCKHVSPSSSAASTLAPTRPTTHPLIQLLIQGWPGWVGPYCWLDTKINYPPHCQSSLHSLVTMTGVVSDDTGAQRLVDINLNVSYRQTYKLLCNLFWSKCTAQTPTFEHKKFNERGVTLWDRQQQRSLFPMVDHLDVSLTLTTSTTSLESTSATNHN